MNTDREYSEYLQADDFADWQHPDVIAFAEAAAGDTNDKQAIAINLRPLHESHFVLMRR